MMLRTFSCCAPFHVFISYLCIFFGGNVYSVNFKFHLTLNSHIWPVAIVLGKWLDLASDPLPLLKVRWDWLGN